MPAPLPIAPRPHHGESITSWVSRTAARYDMTAIDLVRHVLGRRVISPGRLERIDYKADEELETALAAAVSLSPADIRTLRIVGDDGAAGCWYRTWPTWCRKCFRADITERGEIHERAAWRLGSCVVCPVHRILLEDTCCRCVAGAFCSLGHRDGMMQLVCRACRRPVDVEPPARRDTPWHGEAAFGVLLTPSLINLVEALQHDVQEALAGNQSGRSWGCSRSPEILLPIVMHLTLCIVSTTRVKCEPRIELADCLAGLPFVPIYEPITPAVMPQTVAFGVMAIAAAVLKSLHSTCEPSHQWEFDSCLDASSFVRWLQPNMREALKASTAFWPAWTGNAMREIIDVVNKAQSGCRARS